ncbi:MAG: delta-60 repeat domain-containing protein [bacterium]
MRVRSPSLALAFLLIAVASARAGTDGPLDGTFGSSGWDIWNPSFTTSVSVRDLAVRPDGKLAITGRVFAVASREELSCVRNANGSGGTCVNRMYDLGGDNNNDGAGVAVQSDNRTIIVGDADGPAADPDSVLTLVRMTSANGIDVTFDGNTGPFHLNAATNLTGQAVTTFHDEIYFAGSIEVPTSDKSGSDFYVGVRKADGTPKTTFSGDGVQTVAFDLGANGSDYAEGIAVDHLGRVVVAGTASDGTDTRFAVARLTTTGALDSTFSGDGKKTVVVDLGGGADVDFGGVTVDRFGRVILAGVARAASGNRAVVVRLTSSGALDATFGGGDGIVDYAYGATNDIAAVVDVLTLPPPEDRIVIAGDYDPSGSDVSDGFVMVLTPAGDLDSADFNHTGKRSFAPTGDPWNHAQGLAVQAGKLVVLGGYHVTTTSANAAWLARVEMFPIFGDDFEAGHLALWSNAVGD